MQKHNQNPEETDETLDPSILKSGDHKDELAKDMTHETDKLSVGLNIDVHYTTTELKLDLYWEITTCPICSKA